LKAVEEKMASQPCIPKTSFSFIMLLVLIMSMGAIIVKAQVGRLPDDEGTSFSAYVYGFSLVKLKLMEMELSGLKFLLIVVYIGWMPFGSAFTATKQSDLYLGLRNRANNWVDACFLLDFWIFQILVGN
jgi:hypothetical protein